MLDLNAEMMKTHHPLTREHLRARFRNPASYHAVSIKDFVENKETVSVAKGLFRTEEHGRVYVVVFGCKYEMQRAPARHDYLWLMDVQYWALNEDLATSAGNPELAAYFREERTKMLAEYHNARIWDVSGELALHSDIPNSSSDMSELPHGGAYDRILFSYMPGGGLTRIESVHRDTPVHVPQSLAELNSSLPRLVPKPGNAFAISSSPP